MCDTLTPSTLLCSYQKKEAPNMIHGWCRAKVMARNELKDEWSVVFKCRITYCRNGDRNPGIAKNSIWNHSQFIMKSFRISFSLGRINARMRRHYPSHAVQCVTVYYILMSLLWSMSMWQASQVLINNRRKTTLSFRFFMFSWPNIRPPNAETLDVAFFFSCMLQR